MIAILSTTSIRPAKGNESGDRVFRDMTSNNMSNENESTVETAPDPGEDDLDELDGILQHMILRGFREILICVQISWISFPTPRLARHRPQISLKPKYWMEKVSHRKTQLDKRIVFLQILSTMWTIRSSSSKCG